MCLMLVSTLNSSQLSDNSKADYHCCQPFRHCLIDFLLSTVKENFNSLVNVATEVEVLASEFQKFKASLETISLVMDEGLQDFASFSPLIHVSTLLCLVDYVGGGSCV